MKNINTLTLQHYADFYHNLVSLVNFRDITE